MDFPKSVPGVGLVNGKFVDEDQLAGKPGSLIPSAWGNAVTQEILSVIASTGVAPDEARLDQLLVAIDKKVSDSSVQFASQVEAEAGTVANKVMSPLRVFQAIAKVVTQATESAFGWLKVATQALVAAGVNDATAVTPKKLSLAIQTQTFMSVTTTGSATAYKIAPVPAVAALAAGLRFNVTFHIASGSNPTMGLSALGSKLLMQYDSTGVKVAAVVAVSQVSDVVYDGVDFVLQSPLPSGQDPWAMQPIGVPIPVMFGAGEPPSNKAYRYIKLTAADPYNTGALTGEVVTGVAPLVVAYARISLAGSPINGNTVYLLNTERRYIRPGLGGTLQDDALQNITAAIDGLIPSATAVTPSGAISFTASRYSAGQGLAGLGFEGFTFDASRVARTSNETRTKNIGANIYMRVL